MSWSVQGCRCECLLTAPDSRARRGHGRWYQHPPRQVWCDRAPQQDRNVARNMATSFSFHCFYLKARNPSGTFLMGNMWKEDSREIEHQGMQRSAKQRHVSWQRYTNPRELWQAQKQRDKKPGGEHPHKHNVFAISFPTPQSWVLALPVIHSSHNLFAGGIWLPRYL